MQPRAFFIPPPNHPQMKPSLQLPASLVSPIMAFAALSNLAFGLTPMSDNFNDNLLDFSKWEVLDGLGLFSETGGRLNYSVSIPSSFDADSATLFHPSFFNPGSNPGSNENWQIIVDVTNTSTPVSVGEISSAGIEIINMDGDGDFIFLELYSSALDQLPMRRGFVSNLITDGFDNPGSDIDTGNLPGQTSPESDS